MKLSPPQPSASSFWVSLAHTKFSSAFILIDLCMGMKATTVRENLSHLAIRTYSPNIGGFCPGRGILSGGILSRGILSRGILSAHHCITLIIVSKDQATALKLWFRNEKSELCILLNTMQKLWFHPIPLFIKNLSTTAKIKARHYDTALLTI